MKLDKPHLVHKKFTLPKGCSVESFVIREIDGKDELEASRWVSAKATGADDEAALMVEERVRVSVFSVNGQRVEQPYTGLNKWSTKTRNLLLQAWMSLNTVPDDDVAVFLGAAEDLTATAAAAEDVEQLTEAEVKKLKG